MPTFHLNVRGSDGLARDPEGCDYPDLEAAKRAAEETIADAIARPQMYGPHFLKMEAFEITNDDGEIVAIVPIR